MLPHPATPPSCLRAFSCHKRPGLRLCFQSLDLRWMYSCLKFSDNQSRWTLISVWKGNWGTKRAGYPLKPVTEIFLHACGSHTHIFKKNNYKRQTDGEEGEKTAPTWHRTNGEKHKALPQTSKWPWEVYGSSNCHHWICPRTRETCLSPSLPSKRWNGNLSL